MENQLLFEGLIILFLLIFSGFFSGSETALFSLSLIQRERIKHAGKKSGRRINSLLMRPRRLIVTILIGNDMVNIAASVVSATLFVSLMGARGKWVAMGLMTALTLVFAEVIPKTICIAYNERIAPIVSGPLTLFSRIISPLRWIFYKIAITLVKLMGLDKKSATRPLMEDEFRDMVDLSHEGGELKGMERDIIHNVFEFSDTHVNEVMTPAGDMFCLPDDMEAGDVVSAIKNNFHSRIPIYRDSPSNIVGILYVKDFLRTDPKKLQRRGKFLPNIYRMPFFIGESKMVDELFYLFKQKRTHMAICLDKQGTISGLITMEDLLEELFGEIYDEYDREEI